MSGIERRLERVEDRRRLAVARELAAQPAPGEDRELELLALVGLPQILGRDVGELVPERPDLGLLVEVVEVGVELAVERLAHRVAHPRRDVDRRS